MVDFFFTAFIHAFSNSAGRPYGRIIGIASAVSAACRVPTCRYDNSPLTTGTPVRRIGTRGPPCRPCLAALCSCSSPALPFCRCADALGLRAVVPYHSRCSRSASPPAPPLDLAARRRRPSPARLATTGGYYVASTKYGWATRQ